MHRYTTEQKKFITDHVAGLKLQELTELVNAEFGLCLTEKMIRAFKKNYKLKSGTSKGRAAGRSSVFTLAMQAFIADRIKGSSVKGITELVNSTFDTTYKESQLRAYMKNHKLTNGRDCRFKLGCVSYRLGKGWKPTQFKKGSIPGNHRPVGSERIDTDGYTLVKVAETNKWRPKHLVIWEELNGPVPAGHAVIFGDGNKMNLNIDNLILITRQQLAVMNHFGLIKNSAEGTKTGIMIADIHRRIGKIKKNGKIKREV